LGVTGVFDRADVVGLDTIASVMRRQNGILPQVLADRASSGRLGLKTGSGFFHWSPADVERFERRETQHLITQLRAGHVLPAGDAALVRPSGTPVVELDQGVLNEYLQRAMAEYRDCTPESPPRCFGILVGELQDRVLHVRRVEFARSVRGADPVVADEWGNVIIPCFGDAYANERRGFWAEPTGIRAIHDRAVEDGLDILGSIHLHPDWHNIGPEGERSLRISEQPTPVDRYLFANTGWPLNMICYVERSRGRASYNIAAWMSPAHATAEDCVPMPIRHALPVA
jgi:hypothetical protein